jgi:hypothetical protein
MKYLLPLMLGTALLTSPVNIKASELMPGEVDFGTLSPSKSGGEFVEVNLPANLISLAARLVEKEDKEVAQLLNGLKLVHVTAVGVNDDNRADIEKKVKKVQADLQGKGWQRIVTARKEGQEAGVYLAMDAKGAIQGLAVAAIEPQKGAVFVNIVGDIKPEQLSKLGDRLHIDPLKNVKVEEEKKSE